MRLVTESSDMSTVGQGVWHLHMTVQGFFAGKQGDVYIGWPFRIRHKRISLVKL